MTDAVTLDPLAALRLQAEWGADEAIGTAPLDRFAPAPGVKPLLPPAAVVMPPSMPQAETLDELHAALAAFDGCPLRATSTHTVRPDGNPQAGLVLIGEAPGSDDDRSGRAFSGEAGKLLDRVMRSIGLDRSAMLLTTVVPWRPPGNRKLSEGEIQACLPFLFRLLALTRPRHAILLGAIPARVLTGSSDPVRKLRGRWLDVKVPKTDLAVQSLAMPPIDQWLRGAAARQEVWRNLIQLSRALRTG